MNDNGQPQSGIVNNDVDNTDLNCFIVEGGYINSDGSDLYISNDKKLLI